MIIRRKWVAYHHKITSYTFGIGLSISPEVIIITLGFWHWFFEWWGRDSKH